MLYVFENCEKESVFKSEFVCDKIFLTPGIRVRVRVRRHRHRRVTRTKTIAIALGYIGLYTYTSMYIYLTVASRRVASEQSYASKIQNPAIFSQYPRRRTISGCAVAGPRTIILVACLARRAGRCDDADSTLFEHTRPHVGYYIAPIIKIFNSFYFYFSFEFQRTRTDSQ